MSAQQWQVISFDGEQYELKSLALTKLAAERAVGAITSSQYLVDFVSQASASPKIGAVVWVDCDTSLQVGKTYKGELSGNPGELARIGKFPKFIVHNKN